MGRPSKKAVAKKRPGKTPVKPGKPVKTLTPKQTAFVAEYLANGLNGSEAARKAGYAVKSADTQASRLLAMPQIKKALAAKQAPRLKKLEITADRVLQEIAKMAYFDPRKMVTPKGKPIPLHQLSDDCAASLAGFEWVIVGTGARTKAFLTKVKLADKGASLERLGRHLKLFTDKVEHSGQLTLEQLVMGDAK